jgi:integrase
MSVYSVKGKGWRYDFTLKCERHTEAWFKTKKEAVQAEVRRKEELENPRPEEVTPTDMAFLELVNMRLDHVKAYNSDRHYKEYVYMARRWVEQWGKLPCSSITQPVVERFVLERVKISPFTANKEIRYLRSTFNFGKKRKLLIDNPLDGIDFLPMEKKVKYVPSPDDIDKVIAVADPDTQDYLWVIRDTMGRVSEVNRLTWEDVSLEGGYVILYTRKKKGGHLTPRRVPMTEKLHEILARRASERDASKPWVFWHEYISSKTGEKCVGPYQDRKKFMKTLCRKAGVRYFRFHPLRHSGASVMESNNVPIGSIQRILGHENRTTTEIYLHSIGDSERLAISVYEQARKKSHTDSHTDEKRGYVPPDVTP